MYLVHTLHENRELERTDHLSDLEGGNDKNITVDKNQTKIKT